MDTKNTKSVGHYGTGPIHALDLLTRIYYHELYKLFDGMLGISLPFGGLLHPVLRHKKTLEICRHKLGDLELLIALIFWGHSQGGLQAVAQAFRPGSKAKVVICFAAPLDGAKAANPFRFMRRVPRILRWPFDGIVEMMTGSDALNHLHERIRTCMADPDFELPHVILVADYHDVLVSVESQLFWPVGYPADKLHRALLINGQAPDLEGVEILPTGKWQDNHIAIMLAKETMEYVATLLAQLEGDAPQEPPLAA